MILFKRVTNTDPELQQLVKRLDEELKITDGEDHAFYNQFNGLEGIDHLLLGYSKNFATACGGFKKYDQTTAEIKRMYTAPQARGLGMGTALLQELQIWAKAEGYNRLILETGIRQKPAIALYKKAGFERIENYGQYAGVEDSYCFQKQL